MSEIPSDLLFREILSRLSADSLLRFRCVCKEWRSTISDPAFVNFHLDRQLHQDSSSNGVSHLILRGEMCSLYSLSPYLIDSDGDNETFKAKPINHVPYKNYGGSKNILAESSSGIMLISGRSKLDMILWNPLTRKYHNLPAPSLKSLLLFKECSISKASVGLFHSVIGIGYDYSCGDCKVVKILQTYDPRYKTLKSNTMLYSLKSDCWKKSVDIPYRISRSRGGTFLKGAMHWICKAPQVKFGEDLIIAFDLETEDYRVMRWPSELDVVEKPAVHLGMLGGYLCLSCYYQIERLDVWLMKDYGVESSWNKLFSISRGDNIGAVETLRAISYSESTRKVLLQLDKQKLLWFNLQNHSSSKLCIHGGPSTFSCHVCPASLLQVNRHTNLR